MKGWLLLAAGVMTIAVWAGSAAARDSSASAKCRGSVNIGLITGLSGPVASSGTAQLRGVQVAASLANDNGGVHGKCVRIISTDSQYLPSNTVTAFTKLNSVNHIQAFVVGGSAAVLATASLATQNQAVVVNPGGPAANLAGISPYVFNTIELGNLDIAVLANYMWAKGVRKLALAYVNNSTGAPNAGLIGRQWQKRGGSVVANVNWQPNAVDLSSQVAIVAQSGAQGIFLNGQPPENAYFVKQLRALGSNIPVFGNIAIPSTEMLSIAGSAANGATYVVSHLKRSNPDAKTKAFLDRTKKMFGASAISAPLNELVLDALAYDGTNVIIDAMRTAGKSLTGTAIRNAIVKQKTFKDQVTGTISFHSDNTVAKLIDLGQIQNGKFVTLNVINAGG